MAKNKSCKLTPGKIIAVVPISKREYFVAKAMHAILSNPEWMKEYKGDKYLMQKKVVASVAIGYADEVLKELSSEEVTEQ